tara:strand:- start:165 stop:995 length:831 start_codon:yes stop_codon:yes gene_type:complete
MAIGKNRSKIFYNSKSLLNSITTPIIFIVTFLLIFSNKSDSILVTKIKNSGNDIILPVASAVMYPLNKTSELIEKLIYVKELSSENNRLKNEIKKLKEWRTLSIKLVNENNAYKKLLNIEDDNIELSHTVRVISKSSEVFVNSIQIGAGSKNKIKNNSVAINENGLVGRVIGVGKNTSRILLVSDINSNVPVEVFNRDIQAILTGHTSKKLLKLKFIKDNAKISVGQMLVTSGNAGIFPPNLIVGRVFNIVDNEIYVKSFVDFENLDFVQIVNKKK